MDQVPELTLEEQKAKDRKETTELIWGLTFFIVWVATNVVVQCLWILPWMITEGLLPTGVLFVLTFGTVFMMMIEVIAIGALIAGFWVIAAFFWLWVRYPIPAVIITAAVSTAVYVVFSYCGC